MRVVPGFGEVMLILQNGVIARNKKKCKFEISTLKLARFA